MILSEQEYNEQNAKIAKDFDGIIDFISYEEYFIQELEKLGNDNIIDAIDLAIENLEKDNE